MSVVSHPAPVDSATRADRAIRVACVIAAVYLTITIPATLAILRDPVGIPAGLTHLWALALTWSGARSGGSDRTRTLRDWTPLLVGPFLYVQLRWVIAWLGMPHQDALVMGWEKAFFPSDPSATLAPRFADVGLSEALHAAYLSYYALIYLPPLALYLRGRRERFAYTVLALTVAYGVCFIIFALFPVDGPRFLRGPAAAPPGSMRSLALALLEAGSSRGTAFPSSHVAASVVASLCALRFQPLAGIVVAILTAGLAVGAVYGGFHYGVDVLAGLMIGVVCYVLAMAVLPMQARD